MQSKSLFSTATSERLRYIYIAGPWTPRGGAKGGGMFRVADYLIQAQDLSSHAVELRPLDTRGGGTALFSFWVLTTALTKLVAGSLKGELAGVHINIAGRLSLFRKSTVVLLSRILGIPVVLHLHAQPEPFYYLLPSYLKALTRWVFSLAECSLVLGPAAQRFVTADLKVASECVEIIINGVPEPMMARRKITAGMVQRILFVGYVCELKGVNDLLQALAMPGFDRLNLDVSFAGAGDIKAYQSQARQLGINDFVHFEGWSDQQKVASLMAVADVLILPSYVEGLPLVILEAMSNGVAVICTPVGEIPWLLTDQVNACFVQQGDVAGIAVALQRVLRDRIFRETLERNGRDLYEHRFSLNHFFNDVAKVHQRHFGISGQLSKTPHVGPRASP